MCRDESYVGRDSILIESQVNDKEVRAVVPVHRTLLEFLREDLGLTSVKLSCGVQVCGSCTVLVDGVPVSACTYLALEINGKRVETCEGLSPGGDLHPIQKAFIDAGAFQCGFCTPGMIMTAKALLSDYPDPSREDVITYLQGNLCRCTGYKKIIDAILVAARDSGAWGQVEDTHDR
jgi:carbon-monoxide dehydrogenase small subunit